MERISIWSTAVFFYRRKAKQKENAKQCTPTGTKLQARQTICLLPVRIQGQAPT